MLVFSMSFGLPVAVISVALGQGKAAAAAFEGMARQPEPQAKMQTSLIIALAFLEALVIYALVMFFLLYGKLPATDVLIQAISNAGQAAVSATGH